MQAWLLLISAVETAANHSATSLDASEDLHDNLMPEIAQLLEASNCTHIRQPLARILKEYTKATTKFIKFVLNSQPLPPEGQRPRHSFSYKKQDLKKALGIIYDHRSKALHGGIAFPQPMCMPPFPIDATGTKSETPFGLGAYAYNASWTIKDTPMLLHTFEHIVRHALLDWWRKLMAADCENCS